MNVVMSRPLADYASTERTVDESFEIIRGFEAADSVRRLVALIGAG